MREKYKVRAKSEAGDNFKPGKIIHQGKILRPFQIVDLTKEQLEIHGKQWFEKISTDTKPNKIEKAAQKKDAK